MSEIIYTSMIHVIAHPERYHGRAIRVIGFCSFRFEGKSIYLSEGDYRNGISKNGLWLSADHSDAYQKLHESHVIVEGTFDMNIQGHLSRNFGAIVNISRLDRWITP